MALTAPPGNNQASPLFRGLKSAVLYVAWLGLGTFLCLLLVEGGLRLFLGLPTGAFHFRNLDETMLYRPNARLEMVMGPIPYVVESNSLGLRGPEITVAKPAGTTRIIALGDSVTDGFFVDNPDTYPRRLEAWLRERGKTVQVVNTARGGATIDREYEILREIAMPLDPDLVVLTFDTNDYDDARGKTGEAMVNFDSRMASAEAVSEWMLFARTALGELILDMSLRMRYPNYRGIWRDAGDWGPGRYAIEGGADFEANVAHFMEHHVRPHQGVMGYTQWGAPEQAVLDEYLFALGHMAEYLRDRDVALAFVYFPSYNEIYDPEHRFLLRDHLRDGVEALGIPFIDASAAFQQAGREKVLHLAPADYHPNPAGNQVLAETVGRGLLDAGLL